MLERPTTRVESVLQVLRSHTVNQNHFTETQTAQVMSVLHDPYLRDALLLESIDDPAISAALAAAPHTLTKYTSSATDHALIDVVSRFATLLAGQQVPHNDWPPDIPHELNEQDPTLRELVVVARTCTPTRFAATYQANAAEIDYELRYSDSLWESQALGFLNAVFGQGATPIR